MHVLHDVEDIDLMIMDFLHSDAGEHMIAKRPTDEKAHHVQRPHPAFVLLGSLGSGPVDLFSALGCW